MKCEMLSEEVMFVPKRITITLETHEEASAFRHLIECWHYQEGCIMTSDVAAFAGELACTEAIRSLPFWHHIKE